jgi:hypothetical protein
MAIWKIFWQLCHCAHLRRFKVLLNDLLFPPTLFCLFFGCAVTTFKIRPLWQLLHLEFDDTPSVPSLSIQSHSYLKNSGSQVIPVDLKKAFHACITCMKGDWVRIVTIHFLVKKTGVSHCLGNNLSPWIVRPRIMGSTASPWHEEAKSHFRWKKIHRFKVTFVGPTWQPWPLIRGRNHSVHSKLLPCQSDHN